MSDTPERHDARHDERYDDRYVERYDEYDPLADVYGEHWGHVLAGQIEPVLDELVLAGLPDGAAVLDLCCGTGDLVAALAKRGYRVTGLDGSAEMLRLAGERVPDVERAPDVESVPDVELAPGVESVPGGESVPGFESAPAVELVLADARSFSMPGRFRAVVSLFDSLNHVMEPAELAAVFANVREALVPGGRFLFDLNSEAAYLERWDDDFGFVEDDHAVLVRVIYDMQAQVGRFDATVFRADPREPECWRKSDVQLVQRPYEAPEVRSALLAAGFTDVRVLDAEEDLGLVGHVGRVFYVAQNPGEADAPSQ